MVVWVTDKTQWLRYLEKENTELKKVAAVLDCSGREVCRWPGLNRSTLRYRLRPVAERKRLVEEAIVEASLKYPTEGYKKIAGQLRAMGCRSKKNQVQRVLREEGLQVAAPQARVRRA